MKQFMITPAAGKRLIAKAICKHDLVLGALKSGTVVIVAGTTNGYVAEEILSMIGQAEDFSRQRFLRGFALSSIMARTAGPGRLQDESVFPGDVVIVKGKYIMGKEIYDVVDDLREGDVILKGANAVNLKSMQAGILIGHPAGGTITSALHAVVGRRIRLILPVGLEKRVSAEIHDLAELVNGPTAKGFRMMPAPGEVITEIEALKMLTGVRTELIAAGGVAGAEGAVRLAVTGSPDEEREAAELVASIADEPPFIL